MNRKNPKVSVIMPVYNAEKYLRQCLDSIVNQTLKDIEIICVNDGSTDNSLDILNQYAVKDKRFKIYNKKNTGPADTRNIGLKNATGEYLWFVDADDECALNACEIIYNKMSQNNLDAFCFCAKVYNEKAQKEVDFSWYSSFGNIVPQDKFDRILSFNDYLSFCLRINGTLWNKALSNNFVKTHQVKFNSEIFINDDRLFYVNVVMYNPKLLLSLDRLYIYRQNFGDNVVGEVRKENKKIFDIFTYISGLINISDNFSDLQFKKEIFEEILRNLSYWGSVAHPNNKQAFFKKGREVLSKLSFVFPNSVFENNVAYKQCVSFLTGGKYCNFKVKSKKLFGIVIYETYKDNAVKYKKLFGLKYFSKKKKKDKIYYKLLGIPLYSRKKTPIKSVNKFLGLPIYSQKKSKHKTVKKLLGIPLYSKKKTPTKLVKRFLGVPFYRQQRKNSKKVTKILGIPVKKNIVTPKYKKKYLFGVCYKKQTILPNSSGTPNIAALSQKQIDDIINRVSHVAFYSTLQAIDCAERQRASLEEFRGTLQNKKFVLLATGPTVNYFHPISNAVYGGCNRAFQLSDYKLDYLFMQDWAAVKGYIKEIKELDCIKFLGSFFYTIYRYIVFPEDEFLKYNNVRRFYSGAPFQERIYPNIAIYPIYDRFTIAHVVLQFALYAGSKKIYLVGCDTSNSGYFDKSALTAPLDIKGILEGYKKIKEFASVYYPETEIISVNPVGLKGMFRDVYTEAYLADHPEIDRNSVEILENLEKGDA